MIYKIKVIYMKRVIFLILILLLILSMSYSEGFEGLSKKMYCVKKDSVTFCVLNDENKKDAIDLLQETFNELKRFFQYLEINYPERVETKHFKIYKFKYISESVFEKKPAYFLRLINEIGLCLTDKDGKMIKKDVLFYVLLHEVTHTLYRGHSETFWDSFNFLSNAAIDGKFISKGLDLDFCSQKIDIISRK
jgi:hypothetical protein